MLIPVGNLKNYIKSVEMTHKWEQKKANPYGSFGLKSPEKTGLSLFTDQTCSYSTDTINQKLTAGRKLSASEMNYLRENSPELYAKAMKIAAEREMYERELQRCRTKEEARLARMSRAAAFVNDVRGAEARGDAGACADVNMRSAATSDAHNTFTQTRKYLSLPNNLDELELRRKDRSKRAMKDQWVSKPPEEALLYSANARKQSKVQFSAGVGSYASAPAQGDARAVEAHEEQTEATNTPVDLAAAATKYAETAATTTPAAPSEPSTATKKPSISIRA